jgi:high-affinity iron transporter
MLPTFVIGLREGLEAALIVGIVAAFLRQERPGALRWMWAGVALAVGICAAVGVGLHVISEHLPQREQEGLETVVALLAVAAVTYMVVWMRRHARDLRRSLEHEALAALARGSAVALVAMAFFAVIREGFETAVFLLAAFDATTSPMRRAPARSSVSCSRRRSATASTAAAFASTSRASSASPASYSSSSPPGSSRARSTPPTRRVG